MINNDNTNDPSKAYTTNGKFDLGKFNDAFAGQKESQKKINNELDSYNLKMLGGDIVKKSLYQNDMGDIIIGIKNSWFFLMDDLLQQKISTNTFTKDNRLFYLGITFILIAIVMYIYNFFVDEDVPTIG
jgi:hypothetical protein